MSLNMYNASIPVFVRALTNLSEILKKAEIYAAEKKVDESVIINSRLAVDMLPFARQIQIVSDGVKGGVARLSGAEVPSFPDTETTFAELQERIQKTITFAKSVTEAQINGTEDKEIALKVGGNELTFSGYKYLFGFVLPNMFFHITTAYAILRHNGAPLGKMDYLGNPKA